MTTYLWSHEPFLSSPPIKEMAHLLLEKKENIDEVGVYKLENGKFLYIRFYGTKKDLSLGVTDLQEFNTFNEALQLFSLHEIFYEQNS